MDTTCVCVCVNCDVLVYKLPCLPFNFVCHLCWFPVNVLYFLSLSIKYILPAHFFVSLMQVVRNAGTSTKGFIHIYFLFLWKWQPTGAVNFKVFIDVRNFVCVHHVYTCHGQCLISAWCSCWHHFWWKRSISFLAKKWQKWIINCRGWLTAVTITRI